MFFNLFKKKQAISQTSTPNTKSVDYLIVINGNEIAEMDEPPFNIGKWSDEEKYKSLLIEMQPLFDEYRQKGSLDSPYPINGTDDEISIYKKKQKCISLFISSYIQTVKTKDQKYKVASDGRHRMYVAKKYSLDILVHVAAEEIYSKRQ